MTMKPNLIRVNGLLLMLLAFSFNCGTSLVHAEETTVDVHVYRIVTAPFWHSGIVVNGVEYFFDSSNHVTTCEPGDTGRGHHRHHRKMTFQSPHSLEDTERILREVIARWDGTRYDVAAHNCNRFVDDVLRSMGAGKLDSEYIRCSGMAQFVGGVPGGAVLQELVVKGPNGNASLEEALEEDHDRLMALPQNTREEAKRFSQRCEAEWNRFRKRF